jgi:hypothetical protein
MRNFIPDKGYRDAELQSQLISINLEDYLHDEDDDYDTDPPAYYARARKSYMRTLRQQSEDLNELFNEGFEVFSHLRKGDGTTDGQEVVLNAAGSI